MADQTLYTSTAQTDGSVGLAHEQIIRMKRSGAFVNITGDVNNLALNPTKVTVARENYGNKGRPSEQVIGYSYAPTFDVEAVRNPDTKKIAQPWLVDLLNRAAATGADNQAEFQFFDALDEDLPSFEGKFSVSVTRTAGFADKTVYTFTLASDGVVEQIVSPIAGPAIPFLESAGPAGQAPGDQIVIRGYNLTGTTAVTIDGANVLERIVADDNTLVIVIPATVTGTAPIVVTNAAGASTALPYTAQ